MGFLNYFTMLIRKGMGLIAGWFWWGCCFYALLLCFRW